MSPRDTIHTAVMTSDWLCVVSRCQPKRSSHIPAQDKRGPEGGIAASCLDAGCCDFPALGQLHCLVVDPTLHQLGLPAVTSPGLFRTVNWACRSASSLGIFLVQRLV